MAAVTTARELPGSRSSGDSVAEWPLIGTEVRSTKVPALNDDAEWQALIGGELGDSNCIFASGAQSCDGHLNARR